MAKKEPFIEIDISSFEEFEEKYLTIQKNRGFRNSIYRGQSLSDWGLVPSVFRELLALSKIDFDSVKDRIYEEFSGVIYFVIDADRLGLELPGNNFLLINAYNLSDVFKRQFNKWYLSYENTYVEVITLAQHHGVKTRYLDFTYDPYSALYFAAEDATKLILKNSNNKEILNNSFSLWMIDRMYLFNPKCNIIHFDVPKAKNKYLYAQKGLFLSIPLPKINEKNISKENFDIKKVAEKNCYQISSGGNGFKYIWPVIYKFNFSFELAPEFIRKLNERKDVNLMTLKPNLDNITIWKEFREKVNNLWSQLKNAKSGTIRK